MESEINDETVQEEVYEAKSFPARLGGVYFSPREAFTEIGRAPRLVLPIIVLVLLSTVGAWYMTTKIDLAATYSAAIEQAVAQGQITQEAAERQLTLMSAFGLVMAVVGGGIGSLILALVIAGYGKLFSAITAAKNSFKSLLEVSLYVTLAVSIVSMIVSVVILVLKGPGKISAVDADSIVASSVGAWIISIGGNDILPAFLLHLAKTIDIFAIWMIALLAIGFAAVSRKLTTASAATWLIGAYAVYAVISAAIRTAIGAIP